MVNDDTSVSDRKTLLKALRFTGFFSHLAQHAAVNPGLLKESKVATKLENLIPTLKPYVDGRDDFI